MAKGFSQRPGIDFTEKYAPVVKMDSLRTVLSLVAARDLDIMQLDIKTAFLYGEVAEEIYLVPGLSSQKMFIRTKTSTTSVKQSL